MGKKIIFSSKLDNINILTDITDFCRNNDKNLYHWSESRNILDFYRLYIPQELKHNLEFVIYSDWSAEVKCINRDLVKGEIILQSTRKDVANWLVNNIEDEEISRNAYGVFRRIFSFIKPRSAKISIERERNIISIFYKHNTFFDIGKYLQEYKPTKEEKKLDLTSGFYAVLATSGDKFMKDISITAFDKGNDITEVQITHPEMSCYSEYTSFTLKAKTLQDCCSFSEEIIERIGNYEDPRGLSISLYFIIEELCINALIHKDKCPYVKISYIIVDGKKIPLFNYSKAIPDKIKGF